MKISFGRRKSSPLGTLIAFVTIAGVMIVMGLKIWIPMSKPAVDIYDVEDWDDLANESHIVTDINVVWCAFYSETTTETSYGITTKEYESSRGYLIPQMVYYPEYDDEYPEMFIGFKSGDIETMDRMVAESDAWYEVWQYGTARTEDYCKTTCHVDGIIRKMTEEEKGFATDAMLQMGWTQSEIDDQLVPYMIEKKSLGGAKAITLVGFGIAIVGILGFVISKKKSAGVDTPTYYNSPTGTSAGSSVYDPSQSSYSGYENKYYTPESNNEVNAPTYQYGGTNTYGTNQTYSSSYSGDGQVKYDQETGLSEEFLKRSADEKAQKAEEERREIAAQEAAAAAAANPIFGQQPAQQPISASQSFSAYNQMVSTNTNNVAQQKPLSPYEQLMQQSNPSGIYQSQVNASNTSMGGLYGTNPSGDNSNNL